MFNLIRSKMDAAKAVDQNMLRDIGDPDVRKKIESALVKIERNNLLVKEPEFKEMKPAVMLPNDFIETYNKITKLVQMGITDPRELVIGFDIPVNDAYLYVENVLGRVVRKEMTPSQLERLSLYYDNKVRSMEYEIEDFCQTYAVPHDICIAIMLNMKVNEILNTQFPSLMKLIIEDAIKLYETDRPELIKKYDMLGTLVDDEMEFIKDFLMSHSITK